MKTRKTMARRRGFSIVEAAVALAVIVLVSAATMTLILRASEVEKKVAIAMESNEHIENIIECYQWAHGGAGDFAAAMAELGYQEFVTLLPPTCLGQGFITCTCSECDGFSLNIEPVGHNWTGATCTDLKTCSKCDETEGEALGHTDADNDGDHICDREGCSEAGSTCGDSDKDHICDTDSACTVYSTETNAHADSATDADHVCDYGCGEVLEACADTHNDNKCDMCGVEMTEVVPESESVVSSEDEE